MLDDVSSFDPDASSRIDPEDAALRLSEELRPSSITCVSVDILSSDDFLAFCSSVLLDPIEDPSVSEDPCTLVLDLEESRSLLSIIVFVIYVILFGIIIYYQLSIQI